MKRLSASKIKMLFSDKIKFVGRYICGIKEDDSQPYFAVGNAVHMVIEHYNKTGDIDPDRGYKHLEEQISIMDSDPVESSKMRDQLRYSLENYFMTDPPRHERSEESFIWEEGEIPVSGIIDASDGRGIIDYKSVSRFSNEDDKPFMGKINTWKGYKIQALVYANCTKKPDGSNWEYVDFIEILKSDTIIKPTSGYKKSEIIDMIYKQHADPIVEGKTIKELLAHYPVSKEGVNVIRFVVDDEFLALFDTMYARACAEIRSLQKQSLEHIDANEF